MINIARGPGGPAVAACCGPDVPPDVEEEDAMLFAVEELESKGIAHADGFIRQRYLVPSDITLELRVDGGLHRTHRRHRE